MALLAAGCAGPTGTDKVVTAQVRGEGRQAAERVEVTCTPSGAVVEETTVAAQPEGVHYRFINTSTQELHISYWMGGDALPAGGQLDLVRSAIPGVATTVSCAATIDDLPGSEVALEVVDPNRVYVPVPACTGGGMTRDFVAGAAETGDPVALIQKLDPDARGVGYPQGHLRQVYTGELLYGWERLDNGWVPTYTTTCS